MEIDTLDIKWDYGSSIILHIFDDEGRLRKQKFKNKFKLWEEVLYDENCNIRRIITENMNSKFIYNDCNKLTKRIDQGLLGDVTTTTYDDLERPIKSITTLNSELEMERQLVNEFEYDDESNTRMTTSKVILIDDETHEEIVQSHIYYFSHLNEYGGYTPELDWYRVTYDLDGNMDVHHSRRLKGEEICEKRPDL